MSTSFPTLTLFTDQNFGEIVYNHLNILQTSSSLLIFYASKALLAASTIFLTSCTPLSTTFSICVPAFFKSSGLADFANCIALNFFCCPCLAFLTALLATSPAFCAALTVAFLDSAVGGGMGIESSRGFVASGWGVRFRFADWIVEVIGLRCCGLLSVLLSFTCYFCHRQKRESYLLLTNHNLHNPSFRHHLRQITQLDSTALLQLHPQVLKNVRIEPSSLSQLRKVILQLCDGIADICFQSAEVEGVF